MIKLNLFSRNLSLIRIYGTQFMDGLSVAKAGLTMRLTP